MKTFTLQDYLSALYDDAGHLIGPKQSDMILRRAREDADITLEEYGVIFDAAHGREVTA